MPFYEYSCPKCKTTFDMMRTIAQRNDPVRCPECGYKKVKRELSKIAATLRFGESCRPRGRFT